MSAEKSNLNNGVLLEFRYWSILYLAVALLATCYVFFDGLAYMVKDWEREEFSHGYMIPLISLYLLILQLPKLSNQVFRYQTFGVLVIALGIATFLLGELSALYVIVQYGFILVIFGIAIALIGVRGALIIGVPLCYLLFMIPLPNFLLFNLSQKLQLISSSLGVYILRLMDVSVFLEGNVIDLGTYQLQVVDACSGLRYLFPLMSFGFLIAYLYKSSLWKRVVIFLSTIPITIFMNSFRIAVIGLTVDIWGIAAAEGFLHDFEGWVIFMACLLLLAIEIYLLNVITGSKESIINKLSIHIPSTILTKNLVDNVNKIRAPAVAAIAVLLIAIPLKSVITHRDEDVPVRHSFIQMPLIIDNWMGREGRLEKDVFEALKVDDYIVASYINSTTSNIVNLYIAYYSSQRKGASVHSPKTCLPGGGWEITEFSQIELPHIQMYSENPLRINRAIIQNGSSRNLVYYWFQQRGRIITDEYLLKWYIFYDSLTKNRTDGSLVRLIVDISDGKDITKAESEMQDLIKKLSPLLPEYIPE